MIQKIISKLLEYYLAMTWRSLLPTCCVFFMIILHACPIKCYQYAVPAFGIVTYAKMFYRYMKDHPSSCSCGRCVFLISVQESIDCEEGWPSNAIKHGVTITIMQSYVCTRLHVCVEDVYVAFRNMHFRS